MLINDYSSSSLDTLENELLEKLKNVKKNDLIGLVYSFQLTYDEILDNLELKYIPTKRTGNSLNPGIHELSDKNKTLEYILP